jgi:hypothetical protein
VLVRYLNLVGQDAVIRHKVNVDGLCDLPGLDQETDALPTDDEKNAVSAVWGKRGHELARKATYARIIQLVFSLLDGNAPMSCQLLYTP